MRDAATQIASCGALSLIALGVTIAANVAANRLPPPAEIIGGAVLTGALLAIARQTGLRRDGDRHRSCRPGVGASRGLVAAAVVADVYAVAVALPAVRDTIEAGPEESRSLGLVLLVVLPLVTVLPEELAFRGVLLAQLHRHDRTDRRWKRAPVGRDPSGDRIGGLLAPMLAHYAVNRIGLLVVHLLQ